MVWQKELSCLSTNLGEVLERAVQFYPRDRFASASEMYTAIASDSSPQTTATVAVAPGTMHLSKRPSDQPIPAQQTQLMDNTDNEWEEEKPQNPWPGRFFLAALLMGTIAGGMTLGYRVIQQRLNSPDIAPTPEENFEPVPESFPSVKPSSTPGSRPTTTTDGAEACSTQSDSIPKNPNPKKLSDLSQKGPLPPNQGPRLNPMRLHQRLLLSQKQPSHHHRVLTSKPQRSLKRVNLSLSQFSLNRHLRERSLLLLRLSRLLPLIHQ